MDNNGSVWMINFVEANRFLRKRLKRILDAEGSDTATVDMLRAFGSLHQFDTLAPLFGVPRTSIPRSAHRQFASFSLMLSPEAALGDWLNAHGRLARRVVVPASLKWEIRDSGRDSELDQGATCWCFSMACSIKASICSAG